jgi:hypothetical protein
MASGHVDLSKPLKPLTAHAWAILRRLYVERVAAYTINPGVRDRLDREGLAEQRGHRGSFTAYQITDKGRAMVEATPRSTPSPPTTSPPPTPPAAREP